MSFLPLDKSRRAASGPHTAWQASAEKNRTVVVLSQKLGSPTFGPWEQDKAPAIRNIEPFTLETLASSSLTDSRVRPMENTEHYLSLKYADDSVMLLLCLVLWGLGRRPWLSV